MNNKYCYSIKEINDAELIVNHLDYNGIAFDYQSNYPIIHSREITRSSRNIPRIALLAAMLGFIGTIGFEYWAGTYYLPLNIGNKPYFSIVTALPYAFEIAVLFATVASFILFLLISKRDNRQTVRKTNAVYFYIDNDYIDDFNKFCATNKIEYEICEPID